MGFEKIENLWNKPKAGEARKTMRAHESVNHRINDGAMVFFSKPFTFICIASLG